MIIIKSNKIISSLDFILNRLDQYEDYFHILGIKYSGKDGEELSQEEKKKKNWMKWIGEFMWRKKCGSIR